MSWRTQERAIGRAVAARDHDAARSLREEALRACEGHPHEIVARLLMARHEAADGNQGRALSHLNSILQHHPERGPILLKLALILRDAPERDEQASDLLQMPEALERLWVPPLHAAPVGGLASVLGVHDARRAIHRATRRAMEGDATGAAGELTRAILLAPAASLRPATARILTQWAIIAEGAGRADWGTHLARYAVAMAPENRGLRCVAARMACHTEGWDEVERLLAPVLEHDPTNRPARGYQALALLGRGERATARELLSRWGVQHTPEFLAELTLRLLPYDGRFAPPHDSTGGEPPPPPTQPLTVPPRDHAPRRATRGEQLLAREEIDRGLAALDEGGVEPLLGVPDASTAQWLGLKGYGLFKLGRFPEAAAHFRAALSGEPGNPWFVAGVGQALLFAGDAENAIEFFLDIQPVGPDDFGAYFHLGAAYARLGRTHEARRALREAFGRFFVDTLEVCLHPLMKVAIPDEALDGGRGEGEGDGPESSAATG